MTPPRDHRDFLRDMVEACRSIIGFVEGMSLDAYLADEKTRFAVMRGFEIMGEAVRHLPDELKRAHPEIPWPMMVAVRNRLTHGYFGIDDRILFTTIEADLKPLLTPLEQVSKEEGATGS
ncbi:MAG TPA: DUF86 domain-containing protein [Xanthobacteraceae bacterium]|nr:DUF86 domain-containing protein [Xanthobacteraceae bacterium]